MCVCVHFSEILIKYIRWVPRVLQPANLGREERGRGWRGAAHGKSRTKLSAIDRTFFVMHVVCNNVSSLPQPSFRWNDTNDGDFLGSSLLNRLTIGSLLQLLLLLGFVLCKRQSLNFLRKKNQYEGKCCLFLSEEERKKYFNVTKSRDYNRLVVGCINLTLFTTFWALSNSQSYRWLIIEQNK